MCCRAAKICCTKLFFVLLLRIESVIISRALIVVSLASFQGIFLVVVVVDAAQIVAILLNFSFDSRSHAQKVRNK